MLLLYVWIYDMRQSAALPACRLLLYAYLIPIPNNHTSTHIYTHTLSLCPSLSFSLSPSLFLSHFPRAHHTDNNVLRTRCNSNTKIRTNNQVIKKRPDPLKKRREEFVSCIVLCCPPYARKKKKKKKKKYSQSLVPVLILTFRYSHEDLQPSTKGITP